METIFRQKLKILKALAETDAKIFDRHGIPVSPRSRDEIMWHPLLMQMISELTELEKKRFGKLSKQYRELQYRLRFLSEGTLSRWTDDLLHNIETGEWILITEEEQEKEANYA